MCSVAPGIAASGSAEAGGTMRSRRGTAMKAGPAKASGETACPATSHRPRAVSLRPYQPASASRATGAASGATCHVYVAEDWLAALVAPTDEELERLDDAFEVNPASRLSCQILMRPELDGLVVTLAPGSEP